VPYLAIFLVTLYAFPTVGGTLPYINELPGALETYVAAVLTPMLLVGLVLYGRNSGQSAVPKAILLCLVMCLIIYTVKYVALILTENGLKLGFQIWRDRSLGFIFAATICFCIAQLPSLLRRAKFLAYLTHGLTIVFILQVALAFYEARTGIILERQESELATATSLIYARDLLGQTNFGILSLGLQHPITGLLGQFNRFGAVCVFFNLLFLVQLSIKWRWSYLFLTVLVLAAAILNTTKTAVIAIVVTDFLILIVNRETPRTVRWLMGIMALATVAILGETIMQFVLLQMGGSDTISARKVLWSSLWDLYKEFGLKSVTTVFFGFDYAFFLSQGVSKTGSLLSYGSFENEGLLLIFNYGLVGFFAYVYAFIIDPFRHAMKMDRSVRIIMILLPVNIAFCSITLDCQSTWYTLPIIITIFMVCLTKHEQKNVSLGLPPLKTA
jgi:hypothetical protein